MQGILQSARNRLLHRVCVTGSATRGRLISAYCAITIAACLPSRLLHGD